MTSTRSEVPAGALAGRRVVLGVTGGIAAYKAVEVCRRLVDAGALVSPVLTAAATRFVGVTTFSALASEPAATELFGAADPIPHTRLGQRADLVLVAPATARLIGEYAAGIARDLLGATLLATRAPVLICPAMHTEMWEHPAVQENLAVLERRGVAVLAPTSGRLAGGDVGAGRLAEPSDIVAAAAGLLAGRRRGRDLSGRRILVTAGGTREPIDAVRYLANRSSGRQGHAIAAAAAARGASVCLVTTSELAPPGGVEVVRVSSAAELAAAVRAHAPSADVVVMAAAVADFRPVRAIAGKLAKRDGIPELVLEPTEDVLAELGASRRPGQVLVGFAAEVAASTEDLEARALRKLEDKQVDLVVANDVGQPDVGFGYETNAVSIVGAAGVLTRVPLAAKPTIADAILDAVAERLASRADRGDEQ
ncbi:MAG: bifunctional phosphopantothenoylcysteine decarboxylase/phosphopantothenate--cysteine ligase CoaBC [Actinomycetota bacterium]|nr:bifunctional phosphopantothenoylcysteine decarboxylase/phosphopantothenate--cysteine ligase CoaBC [Actinomycetota bacterium]